MAVLLDIQESQGTSLAELALKAVASAASS